MKKAMALLGVTLVSGLILSTAQEIKAQETSENIIAVRSRRGGSRSSSRGSRSGSKSGFGSSKGHHSDGINLIVGQVRVTSQVVIMTVTMDLV